METISPKRSMCQRFLFQEVQHILALYSLGEHGRLSPQDTCIIPHGCEFVKHFGKNFFKNIYAEMGINIRKGVCSVNSSRRR